MKPIILHDGPNFLEILQALLPVELLDACDFRPVAPRSGAVSVARTLIIKYHVPVALMFDTKTMDPGIISETVGGTNYLMLSVAGKIPIEVIACVPQVECVFFQDLIDLRRIFPKLKPHFIPQFARTQPREQLEHLFREAGGPDDLAGFLSELTPSEIESLRTTKPLQQLLAFVERALVPLPG